MHNSYFHKKLLNIKIFCLFFLCSLPILESQATISLRTVSYNVFARWPKLAGKEGQNERLKAIAYALYAHHEIGDCENMPINLCQPKADIISINEAWCPTYILGYGLCEQNNSRDLLIDEMAKYGWHFHSSVAEGFLANGKVVSGGTIIFSKWPIENIVTDVFQDALEEDSLAAKGIIYARIIKQDEDGNFLTINLFATHLQAWPTTKAAAVRQKQIMQIKNLLNKLHKKANMPKNKSEAIIFQGDMNIDMVKFPSEVFGVGKQISLLELLNGSMPKWNINSEKFSSNPNNNILVGKDGAAVKLNCQKEYIKNISPDFNYPQEKSYCTSIINSNYRDPNGQKILPFFLNRYGELDVFDGNMQCMAYCPCCQHEMLDYIIYSNEQEKYLQPITSDFAIIKLKAIKSLNYKFGFCHNLECINDKKQTYNEMISDELSDHYPVVANFVFDSKNEKLNLSGCAFSTAEEAKGALLNQDVSKVCKLSFNGCGCEIDNAETSNCHFSFLTSKCYYKPQGL